VYKQYEPRQEDVRSTYNVT